MTTIASRIESGAGARMHALATELFPFCRSITGDGVRATLSEIADRIPLEIHKVPSGTEVLDWTIPDEWNIRDAHVTAPNGRRVVDFADSNLHVVSYSEPVNETMTLDELRPHLHVHAENPLGIPIARRTTRAPGASASRRSNSIGLDDGLYDVMIDSTLEPGSLTYGEWSLPGDTEEELLLTTHICHPSLANDNLSGSRS